jgi:serine/threonine protein kinase
MGRVYCAVHPGIGGRVAIKLLPDSYSHDRRRLDRFFAEARAVNLIRHEKIVNVIDLATLPDGRPYIVMEYLDGAPLAAVVGKSPPHDALARFLVEVLDAVGAAHERGIVHRDLKPDNLFVTPNGHAKVLDFGIAKLAHDDARGASTRTGALLGTPRYMSPEQALAREVDARSDLYALGVVLYECVTGHPPFEATSTFELLKMHIEATPPHPRDRCPDLPKPLEDVILRALEKEPDERFASAKEMSAALLHFIHDYPGDSAFHLGRLLPPKAAPGGPTITDQLDGSSTEVTGLPTIPDVRTTAGVASSRVGMVQTPASRSRTGLIAFALVLAIMLGAAAGASYMTLGESGQMDTVATKDLPVGIPTPSPPDPYAPVPAPASVSAALGGPGIQITVEKTPPKPPPDHGGLDYSHFDAVAVIADAQRRAREIFPDATLVSFCAGQIDLATGIGDISEAGGVSYTFFSPSIIAKFVPGDVIPECSVLVSYDATKDIAIEKGRQNDCRDGVVPRPTCTMKQMLEKARKHGIPKVGTASVTYAMHAAPQWYVTVWDPDVALRVDDDCN